jgi:hypothetical protein
MEKQTVQLTYQHCAQHANNWEALGRNYTAVQREGFEGKPGYVIFHLLDLDTVDMGIRIMVTENDPDLNVFFLPSGGYSNNYTYKMDDVPVQPFRNPERISAWRDFISAMLTSNL